MDCCSVPSSFPSSCLGFCCRRGEGEQAEPWSAGLFVCSGSLAVRQNYAAAIMRFVAGVCDRMRGSSRQSVVDLATSMGIPRLVIDVRHGAC